MNRLSLAGVLRRAFFFCAFSSVAVAAGDDVVVVRVGTGTATLDATTAAVFLDRFASDGTAGTSIAMPIAADGMSIQMAFTLSGNGTTEGALAGNPDGHFLTLAGYGVAPGAPISNALRVVARIDAQGTVDTSTTLSNGFTTAVRGAVTDDGNQFWITGSGSGTGGGGATGGIWYELVGLTGGTQLVSSPSSVRAISIVDGQLYADSGSGGTSNIFKVGTGMPTTFDPVTTALPGMPTSNLSPYGFAFFDRAGVKGIDTVYVADDRTVANGGGIQKWSFNGTTWSLTKTFSNGITTGTRGLAAEVVAGKVVIYATTAETAQNKLVKLIDDGSANPAFVTLSTAAANTIYRGVAMAWVPPLYDDIFENDFD
jgi:hypothetical protein